MPQSEAPGAWPRRLKQAAAISATGAALIAPWVGAGAAASFTPDDQPTGWVSRPALTSYDVRSGNEVVYRADYKAGLWIGTVRANHINAAGEVQITSPWALGDTATALSANHWDTGRRIVTRHSGGANVAFRHASLSAAQQATLGGTVAIQQALVNYVRGDRSNEAPSGTKLRARDAVQGDIQHSSLVHWNHGGGVRRLYIGGNDGMLHAFDAATGNEVFAYVPSMLLSRLPLLASNPYVHRLYVDGGLMASEVMIGAASRTLLAGALGGGGRGLFMLDVTNPSPASEAAAASVIKWEITPASAGFANLGYTYAAPRIARLNNGVAAVVVGNGYLNTGTGRASLFVINADTGARICEIDTGAGSLASPNGLSTATLVDTNADGKVDYAYAGDLDGKLWRFDLRGAAAPACSAALMMTTSPVQPITTAPAVFDHPKGGRMVLFGTGSTLSAAAANDTDVYAAYGYWDGAPAANVSWLTQSATEVMANGKRLRTVTSNVPNWASGGHLGWRLELVEGERVVGENQFVNDDRYYFTTTNPTEPAVNPGDAEGANWLMEVNALTGGSPPGPTFDVNGDGKVDAADNVDGAVVVGDYLGAGVTSQAVLTDQGALSQTLLNRQSDIDYSPPTVNGDAGVSGGHFDIDFFFMSGKKFSRVKHTHEYDDIFDVTGVNFLNASDSAYNLGTKLAGTTEFKVLVMNQYLNPASSMSVGGAPFESVKTYKGLASITDANVLLTGLPNYKLSTVNTLAWKLPLDAFKSKDWWGDGNAARAGLIPTVYSCVWGVKSDGSPESPSIDGPNGERHNGALTIQIIKSTTPAAALELNHLAGGAKYGWRVKQSSFKNYVLAEYSLYWHHPNGRCYGKAGWVPNPPEDFASDASAKTPASGSQDPKDGLYGVTPATVTVTSVSTTVNANVTTTIVTYSDGKTQKTVVTLSGDGTESVRITRRDGSVTDFTRASAGETVRGQQEAMQPSRRINWREVIRQ